MAASLADARMGYLRGTKIRRQFYSQREGKDHVQVSDGASASTTGLPLGSISVSLYGKIKRYVYRSGSEMETMKRNYAMASSSGLQICEFDADSEL